MIELRSLRKSYRTKHGGWHTVFENMDLTIPPTMNLGVLGRNGSGKSTLLRIISGLEVPDRGEVITSNRRLSWPLGSPAGIHGSLTGRENIRFVSKIYGKDFDDTFAFVESFADLKDYMHMPVKTYSSGMKSRLGFGISMAIEFDTYLIDEGFSAGDTSFREKTQALFEERAARANVIIVSHNPATITRMCNAVGILQNGQIRLYTNIEEGIEVYKRL